MLKINNLHLAYKENKVLKGISLDFKPNQLIGIVGLNGAGKTSFLNAIYGVAHFQEGSVELNESPVLSTQIAFLETKNYFYPRITGKEYLQLFKIGQPNFDFDAWNEVFGLPLDHLISTYSTGMKKKLAFMGILSLNRPVLILDEPFNGLDLETNETIKRILFLLKDKNKILLITSHIMETLTSICDQIHYLNDGKIEASFKETEFDQLEDLLKGRQKENLKSLVDDL